MPLIRTIPLLMLALLAFMAGPSSANELGTAGPLSLSYTPGPERMHCGTGDQVSSNAACALPAAATPHSPKQTSAARIARGMAAFKLRRLGDAEAAFEGAVDADPASPRAHLTMARYGLSMALLYSSAEYLGVARRHLQQAEALAPDDLDVVSTRAYLLFYHGRRMDALKLYDAVLLQDHKHISARENRANVLTWDGRFEKALADYDVLLELSPDNQSWRYLRASIHLRLGHHRRAAADLDVYIERNPYDRETYIARATAYMGYGQADQALDDINVVLGVAESGMTFVLGNETRAELLLKRSFLHLHLKQHDRAVTDALEAVSIGGTPKILRLKLFLKKRGFAVKINGVVSDTMRQAIKACFAVDRCAAGMFQRT